ncbi:atlastin-like [Contarinia nasturtii]|uniref:atlastin-like n=1 Tax=Contarinia nasturtii TaxID=265458 RepID=UPI0012D4C1B5|nr:atlastin-like [Contarinia nasturtii]
MSSGRALQIITPVNQKFEINLDDFKRILEVDQIKDRNVVIVSVAGAFRKGKSFLLNFFLKYLNAQYKKHDVSDWLGEKETGNRLIGFEFAGGRQAKTSGIWIWSEIFIHDFANGEKVAIMLMDTQGIFDSRTSLKNNTTIFAISMMLSSVQCYNVMQNIQEDDLQHLELFTEYGLLALNKSNEKAFQNLLFIVRDWPNAFQKDTPYGDGKFFLDELLTESASHTSEMTHLRRRIKSSFERVCAYLMPSPGSAVATGRNINGDLSQIDAEFIEHLKKLVPSIFAPEHLIPKKINGQKIRARDLATFLQNYMSIFNSDTLPEPQTVIAATASALLLVLCTDCFNSYDEAMTRKFKEKSKNESEPYFLPLDLKMTHDEAKAQSMSQFVLKQKLGATALIEKFQTELAKKIADKYNSFSEDNNKNTSAFKTRVVADLRVLHTECIASYISAMEKSLNQSNPLSKHDLHQIHGNESKVSTSKFENTRKFGSDELIETFRSKLGNDINVLFMKYDRQNDEARQVIQNLKKKSEEEQARAIELIKAEEMDRKIKEGQADLMNSQLIDTCVTSYMSSVQTSLAGENQFFTQSELEEIHKNAKKDAVSMFERDHDKNGSSTNMLVSRLQSDLDRNFMQFILQNDNKRRQKEAADENERMRDQMERMRAELKAVKNQGTGSSCQIL